MERPRRKLFLFINAERGVHGHLASQFFSTRCARPYSFLAWAHLKRRLLSRLRKTGRKEKGEEATSLVQLHNRRPRCQGSFNLANTQLFNVVSR